MNKKYIFLAAFVFLAILKNASFANAAIMPSLNLSYLANNTVQVTVYANPNASIQLYYTNQYSSASFYGTLGITDYSGYFSTTLANNYVIPQNSQLYIVVDGMTSNTVQLPNYNSYSYGNYSYNNYNYSNYYPASYGVNNISVAVGQSTTFALSGSYNNNYYISSNSSLVGTNISGNILTVYGITVGNATLSVCSYYNSCTSIYVTVYNNLNYAQYQYYPQYQNYTQYQTYPQYQYQNQYANQYYTQYQYPISLSQSSITISAGQNSSVIISGSGSYYISSTSDPSIVSASVNGNLLNIYGYNSGSATVTVCQNSGSCASLYVNVVNNNSYQYTTTRHYFHRYNNGNYQYNNTYPLAY